MKVLQFPFSSNVKAFNDELGSRQLLRLQSSCALPERRASERTGKNGNRKPQNFPKKYETHWNPKQIQTAPAYNWLRHGKPPWLHIEL